MPKIEPLLPPRQTKYVEFKPLSAPRAVLQIFVTIPAEILFRKFRRKFWWPLIGRRPAPLRGEHD